MNYEPNTKKWNIGDIVIHDYDAKKPYMLMIVTEKARDGRIGTRYIYPGWIWNKHKKIPYRDIPTSARHYGKLWVYEQHEQKDLHDPARFDITVPNLCEIKAYWGLMKRKLK